MKECNILFHMDEEGHAETQLKGNPIEILSCLVTLTENICTCLNIQVSDFMMTFPFLSKASKATLKQTTEFDIDAMKKQMGIDPHGYDAL